MELFTRTNLARRLLTVGVTLVVCLPMAAMAQELEPRAYSPSPVGTTFLVVSDSQSSGSAVFDATSPFSDVHASFSVATLSAGRVFSLADRQSSLLLALPYARGDVSGEVGGNQRSADRSGLADARLRFSMLLLGGPALEPIAFASQEPRRILGISLDVIAPTGQYDSTKLINISSNRWAFKPEIGLSTPAGRWQWDLYEGVWFFTDNENFYGGHLRAEDPIISTQVHISYTFRARLWVAADATYYTGGSVTVDGAPSTGRQRNVRVGITASLPLAQKQSLKLSYSNGAVTRVGGNFRSIGIAWQYAWGD
jgi:hypothetical protein